MQSKPRFKKPVILSLSLLAALAGWLVFRGIFEGDAQHSYQDGKIPLKQFLGINTYNLQFRPDLYSDAFSLVRDYHTFGLDVGEDTSNETKFPYSRQPMWWEDKSGKVGDFEGIINWEEIYRSWIYYGFEVNVSIMLTHDHPDRWTNLEADAYQYGKAFAEFFGPNGRNLVTSVEVGNEPVPVWPLETYAKVFPAMAQGIRDGDPDLKILTAATRDGRVDEFSVPIRIYKDHTDLIDVIKIHSYAMIPGTQTWERSYPEDPSIEYISAVERTMNWRDRHASHAKVWVTEFGYDTISENPPAEEKWKPFRGVEEHVQAEWLVRSVFEFMRIGVDRAYVFWFNDDDEHAFHGASGVMRFNEPKKSFHALKHLRQTLGDYAFSRVVKRDTDRLHIYEYRHYDPPPNNLIWVVWSPTGKRHFGDGERRETIQIQVPSKPKAAERMAVSESGPEKVPFTMTDSGMIEIEIGEAPIYLKFSD